MSTPSTPNLGQTIKSFWDRPEGKTGKYILAGLGVVGGALLFTFWGIIVPFVLATVANTVLLGAWILGAVAAFLVLTNWRTRMIFQILMRKLTSLWMELDPIGILKNMIAELRKRLDIVNKHISVLAGVRRQLDDNIAENVKRVSEAKANVASVDKMVLNEADPLRKQKLLFTRQTNVDTQVDLTRDTQDLTTLRQQVDKLYSILQRMAMATEYYINQRQHKVDNAEKKYKAVNSAFKAMTAAKGALSPNSAENDLYEQTFQFLADDASMRLGAIDDFAQLTEQYLTDIDVTRGAANFAVLEQLEQASMKLLPANTTEPGFIENLPADTREAVPVKAKSSGSGGDYDRMFGGK